MELHSPDGLRVFYFNIMDRIFKSKTDVPYTIIANEVIKDKELSLQAKGLFAYLQSLPPNWVINKNELVKNHTNGKHATINAFKELEEKGIVMKVAQIRKNGMFSHNEYCVFPNYRHLTDDRKTVDGEPMHGKPLTDNQPLINKEYNNSRINKSRITNTGERFESWWNEYNKKKDRSRCLTKWNRLTNEEQDKCLEVVKDYIAVTPEVKYRKNPLTYLNGKNWEDELPKEKTESEWEKLNRGWK